MSFYRTVLAAVAAVVIATPVFAEEPANTAQSPAAPTPAMQTSDNSSAMQSGTPTEQQGAATAIDGKPNVNKATVKELMKVKGLTAAKARAIVAYRKKHGEFKTMDDLNNVKGLKNMKPEMMKEVQDQLSVE